ncbi:hypothetical protein Y032_0251g171 [Ancylostoma ceylanicum]|uniref:Uncharacterized protein n=1 Tax=Ancylostoma ceylanicum TaxID=53326 RepID=A0A016SD00_9BILA|nr:hypothetical protein Y032_0251g171 [Ancylostoma ceylanicum]
MSSIIPRVAVRQANKFPKPNNPFMSAQRWVIRSLILERKTKLDRCSEAQPPQGDHVNPLLKPETVEAAPLEKESEFSITKFFRMSWTQRLSSENEFVALIRFRLISELLLLLNPHHVLGVEAYF